MVFVMLFNVLRQFTDGTTDTSTGMWALLSGNAFNIVGNFLLIYGIGPFPELGLLGAGISTLLSRILTAALLAGVILFRKRYAPYRLGFLAHKLRLEGVRYINRQSLPISLQMGMESGSFTFSAIMAGWLGALQLASFQVMVTVGTLGFLLYYSFGAGMSIRVATFVGTNDWPRVRLAAKAGCHILIAMSIIASLAIFLFSEPLIRLFTTDEDVLVMSLSLIFPLMLYQMGDAMQICFANALRARPSRHIPRHVYDVDSICQLPDGQYPFRLPLGLSSRTGHYRHFHSFLARSLCSGVSLLLLFPPSVTQESPPLRQPVCLRKPVIPPFFGFRTSRFPPENQIQPPNP